MCIRKCASVTRKNKRPPLPCHELYSKSHVLNASMTFNMPRAFLINMPFNIVLLMCVYYACKQEGARKHHLMPCAHTPSGNPGKCQVFWAVVWRHPAGREEEVDGFLCWDANAAGHGCFTGRNIISNPNPATAPPLFYVIMTFRPFMLMSFSYIQYNISIFMAVGEIVLARSEWVHITSPHESQFVLYQLVLESPKALCLDPLLI